MAGLIESIGTSGMTLYAVIRDTTGKVWNGSTFETYNVSNWATYAVSLTEQTSSGYYKASMPGSITSGKYTFAIHSGSPATAGDPVFDRGFIDWNGSTENYLGLIVDKLPTGDISGFDPISDVVYLGSNQSGVTIGTVNALGSTARTQINDEMLDVLYTDTLSELSSIPGATPTIASVFKLLYMMARNKRTATSTEEKIYNNAGTAIATATVSDNGTTFTKEQFT